MPKQELPVNFKDDILASSMAGKRKYLIIGITGIRKDRSVRQTEAVSEDCRFGRFISEENLISTAIKNGRKERFMEK